MPVNMVSHAHGQGYADLHFVIPETIEKIDYGKGPYYADRGNFATAGYVDFSLRDRLDPLPHHRRGRIVQHPAAGGASSTCWTANAATPTWPPNTA